MDPNLRGAGNNGTSDAPPSPMDCKAGVAGRSAVGWVEYRAVGTADALVVDNPVRDDVGRWIRSDTSRGSIPCRLSSDCLGHRAACVRRNLLLAQLVGVQG